jgi:hypothetical protein
MKKWRLRSRNPRLMAGGTDRPYHATPPLPDSTNFADRQWPFGQYRSLTVCFVLLDKRVSEYAMPVTRGERYRSQISVVATV